MALGRNIDRIERNIESIESKFAKIFKWPKNCEDGSDFDDFWTESIVSTQSIFSKFFERTKRKNIFLNLRIFFEKYSIIFLMKGGFSDRSPRLVASDSETW